MGARAGARGLRGLLAAGVWALAACHHDAAAPVVITPFDNAAAISAGMLALDTAFGSPNIQSLWGLGGNMHVAGAPPLGGQCAASSPSSTSPFSVPLAGGMIPDSLKKRVFVLASPYNTYTLSATDTSGPANGVRFVLYQVDTLANLHQPPTIVGTLDLLNPAGGTGPLEVRVLNGILPNADYAMTALGRRGSDTALLVGTATGGTRTVSFRDSVTRLVPSISSTTNLVAVLTDSIGDITVNLTAAQYAYDLYDGNYIADFAVTHAGRTVRMTGNIFTYCLLPSYDLTVVADGDTIAQIGDQMNVVGPSVNPQKGFTLTAEQQIAILQVLYGQLRIFRSLLGFSLPAAAVLPP